jgi:hypothetical protein
MQRKVKFGDFHALMAALFGKTTSDPDAYVRALKDNVMNDKTGLKLTSQSAWPSFWAAFQDYNEEINTAEMDARCSRKRETVH